MNRQARVARKGDRCQVVNAASPKMNGRIVRVLGNSITAVFKNVFTGEAVEATANRCSFDMDDLNPPYWNGRLDSRYIRTECLKVIPRAKRKAEQTDSAGA